MNVTRVRPPPAEGEWRTLFAAPVAAEVMIELFSLPLTADVLLAWYRTIVDAVLDGAVFIVQHPQRFVERIVENPLGADFITGGVADGFGRGDHSLCP